MTAPATQGALLWYQHRKSKFCLQAWVIIGSFVACAFHSNTRSTVYWQLLNGNLAPWFRGSKGILLWGPGAPLTMSIFNLRLMQDEAQPSKRFTLTSYNLSFGISKSYEVLH